MKTTRHTLGTAAVAALVATIALTAATTDVAAQTLRWQPGEPRNFGLHVGATVINVGGATFGGIVLGADVLATPKDLFSLEFNYATGGRQQLGYYHYQITSGKDSGDIRTDGKMMYGYNSTEYLVSYSRLFGIAKGWQLRLGPAAGIAGITGSDSYIDKVDVVEGLPKVERVSKHTYKVGLLAGVRWNFSRRGSLDLNYLAAAQGGIVFEKRKKRVFDDTVTLARKEFGKMSHRVNLTVGWRIGTKRR